MERLLKDLFAEDAPSLFKRARELAQTKETVFSAPVPITTHCKISPPCRYCRWRSMAKLAEMYGADVSIAEAKKKAKAVSQAGIHRIHLASGWVGNDLPEYFYEYTRAIKENSNCELYGFSGAVSKESLSLLKEAGAGGYWCGIEVTGEALFKQIRPGDDYRARIRTLNDAKELGLKTWSGFLFGIGETQEDVISGIEVMKQLEVDSVVIMPFKQMPYTEMEKLSPPNLYEWAKVLAVIRIYLEKADLFTTPETASWGLRAGTNGFFPAFPKTWGQVPGMDELRQMRRKVYDTADELVKEF